MSTIVTNFTTPHSWGEKANEDIRRIFNSLTGDVYGLSPTPEPGYPDYIGDYCEEWLKEENIEVMDITLSDISGGGLLLATDCFNVGAVMDIFQAVARAHNIHKEQAFLVEYAFVPQHGQGYGGGAFIAHEGATSTSFISGELLSYAPESYSAITQAVHGHNEVHFSDEMDKKIAEFIKGLLNPTKKEQWLKN